VKEKGLPVVVVGVPLIVQVVPVPEVQPDKPPGREPLVLLQVTVPLKFEAVSVCEYTVPTVPAGRLVGVIEAVSAPVGTIAHFGSKLKLALYVPPVPPDPPMYNWRSLKKFQAVVPFV